jgi:hypothetical protein
MTVISYRRHRFPPSVIQHDLAGLARAAPLTLRAFSVGIYRMHRAIAVDVKYLG